MKEPELNKGKHIAAFKPGDIITRVAKAVFYKTVWNESLGRTETFVDRYDASLLGEPVKFISIYNNCIYIKRMDGGLKGRITNLHVPDYAYGWDYYEAPEGVEI